MDFDAKLNQFFDAEEFYNVNLLSQREREREREHCKQMYNYWLNQVNNSILMWFGNSQC